MTSSEQMTSSDQMSISVHDESVPCCICKKQDVNVIELCDHVTVHKKCMRKSFNMNDMKILYPEFPHIDCDGFHLMNLSNKNKIVFITYKHYEKDKKIIL